MARIAIGRVAEIGFSIAATFVYGTQAIQMLFGSTDQAMAGRPIAVHVTFLSIYAITLVGLFTDLRFVRVLILRLPLVLLLLVFPVLTVLRSVRPDDSYQRAIAGFGSGLFGLYLFWRFGLDVAIRILAVAMTFAAAGSLFAALFLPNVGLMIDETWAGAWRGLYYHKNSLGAAIALATLLLVYVALTDTPVFRILAALGLVICFLLLVGSRSMTALFVTAACIGFIGWARAMQKAPQAVVILSLIGVASLVSVVVALLTFASVEDAFVLLGKKAGMSGRFPLWEQVAYFIGKRPWLGYGYEAFWNPDATETRLIAAIIKYTPFYSHNGVLETLLTGGAFLFLLVLVFLARFAARAWRFARAHPAMIATFPLVFLGFVILANVSESHLLMRNDLIWAVMLGLAMRLALDGGGTIANDEAQPKAACRGHDHDVPPTGKPGANTPEPVPTGGQCLLRGQCHRQ